jgi:hypothetical protein
MHGHFIAQKKTASRFGLPLLFLFVFIKEKEKIT